ncbi:MAG: uroporphyrinogen-III synthase, partial [Candidatus Rokubacteria bacterium]|nr:uroporphyrinogen-III synthase [Candidatus Rokubacteria bacterium]
TVVVTRAADQARRFVRLLEGEGARVLEVPTIVIEPPPSWAPLDAALEAIADITWIVFTSVNGVAMVDRRLRERGQTWRPLRDRQVAAIGPATARALEEHGVPVALVPDEYRAEGLVAGLRGRVNAGDRILLPRAAQTRDLLVAELRALGAVVAEIPVYVTRRAAADAGPLRDALAAGRVDAVTFTSSSTARGFAGLFTADERRRWFGDLTVASIGPITAATAAEYGLRTSIMPEEFTIPALARALAEYFAAPPARAGERSA